MKRKKKQEIQSFTYINDNTVYVLIDGKLFRARIKNSELIIQEELSVV